MPRKEARQKRRSKKRKKVENRQPTKMKRSRYSEAMVCTMADYDLSRSAILTYLYVNLNCNLASGTSHQIEYQQVADYFDWHPKTVYAAICELEFVGLITVRERGGMVLSIPHQGLIQHMVHQQDYENKEKTFYAELQKMITNKEFERGRHLDASVKLRMYDLLVEECGREGRWKPKMEDRSHLLEKLEVYAPSE